MGIIIDSEPAAIPASDQSLSSSSSLPAKPPSSLSSPVASNFVKTPMARTKNGLSSLISIWVRLVSCDHR
jgi:hypothetical protein